MQLRAWMRDSYTLGSMAVVLADLFIDVQCLPLVNMHKISQSAIVQSLFTVTCVHARVVPFGGIFGVRTKVLPMDEVPDGATFDLLPNEGAALYLDNPTSSKSAPVNLNDSLEDDSNNGLEDSLDFANENAVEVSS